jgi:hypothetical protein
MAQEKLTRFNERITEDETLQERLAIALELAAGELSDAQLALLAGGYYNPYAPGGPYGPDPGPYYYKPDGNHNETLVSAADFA